VALLERVCAALDATGVRCALIGAAALAAAGVARSTYDIDLLTTDPRSLGEGVWKDVRVGGDRVPRVRPGRRRRSLRSVARGFVARRAARRRVIVGRFDYGGAHAIGEQSAARAQARRSFVRAI
jgi:hypothetical protein